MKPDASRIAIAALAAATLGNLSYSACAAQPLNQIPLEALEALELETERTLLEQQAARRQVAPEPSADALRALERGEQALRAQREAEMAEPAPTRDAIRALESADAQTRIERDDTALVEGVFRPFELRLDIAPETVLVTSRGMPFLTVQDFNQRVGSARGVDLYDARRSALQGIIRTRLQAMMAEDAGLADDPAVERRLARALDDLHPGAQTVDLKRFSVSDAEAGLYYKANRELFRRPDTGTRALVAVRATEGDAKTLLARIRSDPDDPDHWLQPQPIRGEQLPGPVRDALFHAEPGDITGVIETPTGYYIARLAERNAFDRYLVQARTFASAAAARAATERSAAGDLFGPDADGGAPAPVSVDELPAAARAQVPLLELGQISEPIAVPIGTMLVRLAARWSEAPIERATVIPVPSIDAGMRLLGAMKRGDMPADVAARIVAETDLPEPLLELARTLRIGEPGGPVRTDLGTFLIRVDARKREKYQTFVEAKDTIRRRLRAARIAPEDKRAYYEAHRDDFRLPAPRRILDVLVSGGEADNLQSLRQIAAMADPAARAAAFDAALSERGLESVDAAALPPQTTDLIAALDPDAVSGLVSTGLGHFVVRVRAVEDPAYADLDDVAPEIGALLADREEASLALAGMRAERDQDIAAEAAQEKTLSLAYRRDFLRRLDSVSDAEATAWWQRNGATMLAAFGAGPEDIQGLLADQKPLSLEMLKRNVLDERLEKEIDARDRAEQIVVNEYLLDY